MSETAASGYKVNAQDRNEVFGWMRSVGCSRLVVGYCGRQNEYEVRTEEAYDSEGAGMEVFVPRSVREAASAPIHGRYGEFEFSGDRSGELSWNAKNQRILLTGTEDRPMHVEEDL